MMALGQDEVEPWGSVVYDRYTLLGEGAWLHTLSAPHQHKAAYAVHM